MLPTCSLHDFFRTWKAVEGQRTCQRFEKVDYSYAPQMTSSAAQSVRFRLDLDSYQLLDSGTPVHLERQPMELLILLAAMRGRLVSREDIAARLWGSDVFVDADQSINRVVRKLRLVLHDDPERPQFVETVVGKGYRFIGDIDIKGAVNERTTSIRPADSGLKPSTDPRYRFNRIFLSVIAVLVVTAAAAVWFWKRTRVSQTAVPFRTIAVLPFNNLSGVPDQEYFADGITESVIADLGRIASLRVISRTSAMHYKHSRETVPEIARELAVDAVLEGSVLRSEDQVRVTAELADGRTGLHVWAETYHKNVRDVLTLQDELARDIASQVQMKFLTQGQSRRASARLVVPEAYEAYLKGRYNWNTWTEEDLKASIAYFERAVQIDPSYAAAWSGLADSYSLMGVLGFSPRNIAIENSREAALKAVGLDEGLSEAHVSLASARLSEHSWSSAEKELQRALALNPNNAMAHQWYGYLLSALGRFDAALSEMKIALELDPLSANKQNSLAATYYRAGRYDEALEEFRKVPDPDGNSAFRHRRMAFIYERRGSKQDAAKEWAAVLHWSGKTDTFFQRKLASEGYESAKAALLRQEIRDLQTQMQRGHPGRLAITIAGDYATLGELDRAFEWLQRALEEQESDLMYLKVDNRFEPLRSDARFAGIARRLGLQ